ncbi:GntR family transcriptional regulator [uncultured Amnibacterium sp.]|uniref:GntR family transcriptional regulator n=1 Tax=uncultured Amnibacterium sp. TaxID=1631851 RepID=UPI0035CC6441
MLSDDRPIFQQIADQLADGILAGTYPPGAPVPSTNELAAFHRINPATVGKGVNVLVDAGVLEKRRGLGMYVTDGARERLLADRRAAFARDFVAPLLTEARSLGLARTEVHRIIDQEVEQ